MEIFYNACARGTRCTYRVSATDPETQRILDGTGMNNVPVGTAHRSSVSNDYSSASSPLMVIITPDDKQQGMQTFPIVPPLPVDSSVRIGVKVSPMNNRLLVYCHSFVAILDPPLDEIQPSFAQNIHEITRANAYHSTLIWTSMIPSYLKSQASTPSRQLMYSPSSSSTSNFNNINSTKTSNLMIMDEEANYSPSLGTRTKNIDRTEHDRQVLDVQWHPLSSNHIVILNRAGIVLLENFRRTVSSSLDTTGTVILTIPFPRQWSMSAFLENRTTPTSITFGSPRTGSWDIFTLFILCTNGNIYTYSPIIASGMVLSKTEWKALHQRTLDIDTKVNDTYLKAQAYHKLPKPVAEPTRLEKEYDALPAETQILYESGIGLSRRWLEDNWYPMNDDYVQYLSNDDHPLFGKNLSPEYKPPASLETETVLALQRSVRFIPSLNGPLPVYPSPSSSSLIDACSILSHQPLYHRPTIDSSQPYATVFSILYTNGNVITCMNSTPMIPSWRLVSVLPEDTASISDDGYDIAAYGCFVANDNIRYPKEVINSSSSSSSSVVSSSSVPLASPTKSVSIMRTNNDIKESTVAKLTSPTQTIISPFQANQDIQNKRYRRTNGTGATRLCSLRIVNLYPSSAIFTPFIVIDTLHIPFTDEQNTSNLPMIGTLMRNPSMLDDYLVINLSTVVAVAPTWRTMINHCLKTNPSKIPTVTADTEFQHIRTSAYINRVWPYMNEDVKCELYKVEGVSPVYDASILSDYTVSGVQVWVVPKNHRQPLDYFRQRIDAAVREHKEDELYQSGNIRLMPYFLTIPLDENTTIGSKYLSRRSYRADTSRIAHVTLPSDWVTEDTDTNKTFIEERQRHYDKETKLYLFQQLHLLKHRRALYIDKLNELQKSPAPTTDSSADKNKVRVLTKEDVQQKVTYYDQLIKLLGNGEKFETFTPDIWGNFIDPDKVTVLKSIYIIQELMELYKTEDTIEEMDRHDFLRMHAEVAVRRIAKLREVYKTAADYNKLVRESLFNETIGTQTVKYKLEQRVETFLDTWDDYENRVLLYETKAKHLSARLQRILRLLQAHTTLEKMSANPNGPEYDRYGANLLYDLYTLRRDVVERVTPHYDSKIAAVHEELKTIETHQTRIAKEIETVEKIVETERKDTTDSSKERLAEYTGKLQELQAQKDQHLRREERLRNDITEMLKEYTDYKRRLANSEAIYYEPTEPTMYTTGIASTGPTAVHRYALKVPPPDSEDEASPTTLLKRLSIVAATIAKDRCNRALRESLQKYDNLIGKLRAKNAHILTVTNNYFTTKDLYRHNQEQMNRELLTNGSPLKGVRSPSLMNGTTSTALTVTSPNANTNSTELERYTTDATNSYTRISNFNIGIKEHSEKLQKHIDNAEKMVMYIKHQLRSNSVGTNTGSSSNDNGYDNGSRSASKSVLSPGSRSRLDMLISSSSQQRTPSSASKK